MSKLNPSRRDVLKASASAAAMLALGVPSVSSTGGYRTNNIRFAMVGVGGRGGAHLGPASELGEIVAICDVDLPTLARVMQEYPRAAAFTDFRRMLDVMHKQIDAVVVATPDHTHAPAASMAMRLGKHCYCEKPLTRSIYEARRLGALAKQHRVMTQMGNQGTASDTLRNTAKVIASGALGAVKEVHCWTNRAGGWWPQGVSRPETKPRPRTVEWDLWLGPSPDRAYAPGYHPFAWRGWWDFGSGALGDIGCHCMNLPFMALDLRDPLAVTAETSGHNRDSFPAWSIVHYEFGARGKRGPLQLHWYDGGKLPSQDLAPGVTYEPNGCLLVCEKGVLYAPHEYGFEAHLLSGEPLPAVEAGAKSPGHFAEFALAIAGGAPPRSNFPGYSSSLTETVVLGNLAVWASGERLEWDARGMKVKGRPEFDPIIKPEYRSGWEV